MRKVAKIAFVDRLLALVITTLSFDRAQFWERAILMFRGRRALLTLMKVVQGDDESQKKRKRSDQALKRK